MSVLYARIHLSNISNGFIPLYEIDLEQKVGYLKARISTLVQQHTNSFDIFHNGRILVEDKILLEIVHSKSIVHCFERFTTYETHKVRTDLKTGTMRSDAQHLFNLISNIQISMTSRVNVLQKVLTEYPELRRNMAAQALIRDSVLFSTLNQPDIISNVARQYPIICIASTFIVDTIKKELALNTILSAQPELVGESTNSSEEDYSTGPSTSLLNQNIDSSRRLSDPEPQHPSRIISSQQLQAALEQISGVSASNMQTSTTRLLNNSLSGERITEQLFRHELQRALSDMPEAFRSTLQDTDTTIGSISQDMQTYSDSQTNLTARNQSDNNFDIPLQYRSHQYADQLRLMVQMGFVDCNENMNYLQMSNGNVEMAINILMGSMS